MLGDRQSDQPAASAQAQTNANELKVMMLQNKLSALYGRMQKIYDSMPSLMSSSDPMSIDNFLADTFTIDTLRQDFIVTLEERNQCQLTLKDTPPSYSSIIAFEELFTRIKYKVHQLTSQMATSGRDNQGSLVKCEKRPSLKLPTLELCSFDGNSELWPIFYETFKSVIHENTDLTDSEKIQYLIGKLKGKALNVCQGIIPSSDNYSVIWNTLVSKYNDKRVLDKIFNLPHVKENSSTDLEDFIDKFSSFHSALTQLKLENLQDFIFIYIVSKKLNLNIIKEFELRYDSSENLPTCTQFITFVRGHSHVLQRAKKMSLPTSSATVVGKGGSIQARKNNYLQSTSLTFPRVNNNNVKTFINVQQNAKCFSCEKTDHSYLAECPKFLSLTPSERFKFSKNHKLCVNCLSNSHTILNCKELTRCSECHKCHHSLLHFPINNSPSSNNNTNKITTAIVTENIASVAAGQPEYGPYDAVSLCSVGECMATADSSSIGRAPPSCGHVYSVLLGTAQCHVVDADGNVVVLRAIIDSASQRDLITTECCKRLKLKLLLPKNNFVSGVGDISNPVEGVTCLTISSRFDRSIQFNIQPMVVNRITSELPTAHIDQNRLDYLHNIPLADNKYYIPAKVDLILGSDLFARILGTNTIARAAGEPVAIETLLGYVIVGKAPVVDPVHSIARTFCTTDEQFDSCLNRFFELEEVPDVSRMLTLDESRCEKYYGDTIRRDLNGRYIVSLPFKDDTSKLGNSIRSAERRYLSLEYRLLSNPVIKKEYDNVFREFLQKNYLRPVDIISDFKNTENQYVIPHHAVIRSDKGTSKLRIVLNASNATSTGKSLNDLLYTGPNIQNDLFRILLAFRLFRVALSADIRQMYMRILTDENHIKFQRLLYRFDTKEPITVFEMTRVPFGLCCSPYLAIRTVRQLAEDEQGRFPAAAVVAKRDMYMDDLSTSSRTIEEGIGLANQLIELFAAGGFELVKFSSNLPEVMAGIPPSNRVSEAVEFSRENHLKILGMYWLPADDAFTFRVNPQPRNCTKRNILSTVARLWDLMGFVAPVTVLAKLIIKSLWKHNIGWDDCPPPNVISLWQRFESELPLLQNIKLPRHLGINDESVISLIGFADASESAYGGVIYLHVYLPATNQTLFNIVCAKSRVAPSKTVISLARMELCANLILAKLMRFVINAYASRCCISNVLAFTDSTVALAWIHSTPTRWQTFVANRVAKIQSALDPRHFHHISGKDNPADCLSRGLTPSQLLEHPLWFKGPPFINTPFAEWPLHQFDPSSVSEIPEIKISVLASIPDPVTSSPVFYELGKRISSWPKLLRIIIYVLRFIRRLPKKFHLSHIDRAEKLVIIDLQKVYFSKEIKEVCSGGKWPPSLLKLHPFMEDGVLRVGGRLNNANLTYDSKHPMLLPRQDHLVNLIIDYYHQKNLHTGPQLLMSLLRQKFWIISARNIVRKRVHQCNVCFKVNPRNEFPIMADLPACRVQEAKAFCHTGVDYAGPLQIVPYHRRGVRPHKAYICLFICLVTKAIHIELASDLSTEVFLNALKRFISRRGPVSVLYSDCGTNFIGAKSYLDSLYKLLESNEYQEKFANELRENSIDWKFNPASAPHFGGLWESNIRSIKTHLYKIVGNQLLTFEETMTVLSQIEAVLNSRPLSLLSSDPSEPLALIPAHFLVMTPLKSLPSEDFTQQNVDLLKRKRVLDKLVQSFWNRWKVEYLNTLQVRKRWLTNCAPIEPGTVVLLKSDNSAPLDWPLGIIERVFPGKDNVVRVVEVRTKTGLYRRPVVKVFPLPNQ